MKKEKQVTNSCQAGKYKIYLLCFVSVILFYCITCILKNIYPFGDKSNLIWDLNIQYSDFFSYYREVLMGNVSLDYSLSKSLGGSLVALWGYYLSSPLNLMLVLFRADQIEQAIFVITVLKLGFCGLTFSIFIEKKYKNLLPWQIWILSVVYAFTQYTVGQMSNIMWLDGVYMLPLVLLGADRFLQKGEKVFCFLMIVFTIIFNWYTGYMNCIFVALYFLYQVILKNFQKGQKIQILEIVKQVLQFYMLEFIAVLGSMAVFLPVLLSQSGGRSLFDDGIFKFSTNGSFLEILRGFMIGSASPSTEITLFCSTIVFVMLGVFFIDKFIPVCEKIISGIFLFVMIGSLFFTPLEHIWVGFKFELSYAFRFAYVVTMALLIIGGRSLENLKFFSAKTIGIVSAELIFVFLLLDLVKRFDEKRLWLQIFLLITYALLLCWGKTGKNAVPFRRLAAGGIILLFVPEILFNARVVIADNYSKESKDYTEYVTSEAELIREVKNGDNSFYRIAKTLYRDKNTTHDSFYLNESLAYQYFGLPQYSSSYDKEAVDVIKDLGYCKSDFPSFYHDPILPADSLLGVKYLLSEKDYCGFELRTEYEPYNGKKVYENRYALPLGFAVSQAVSELKADENPFVYMNDIYSFILGRKCRLFEKTEEYVAEQTAEETIYTFAPLAGNQILYARIGGSGLNLEIGINNGEYQKYSDGWLNHNVITLENIKDGCMLRIKNNQNLTAEIEFYILDCLELEKAVDEINSVGIQNLKIDGEKIMFTGTGENVMLTIPYDSSWRITVDGENVTAKKGADAFMMIPLNREGEASVVMEYKVKGKYFGAALSVLAVVLILGWALTDKRKTGIRV